MVQATSTVDTATQTINIDLLLQVFDWSMIVKYLFSITMQDSLSGANSPEQVTVIKDGTRKWAQHQVCC